MATTKANKTKDDTDWQNDPLLAPIRTFLDREYREQASRMLTYMLYVGCDHDLFTYRNKITRVCLTVSAAGELIACGDGALHSLTVYQTLFPKRPYKRKDWLSTV